MILSGKDAEAIDLADEDMSNIRHKINSKIFFGFFIQKYKT